MKTGNLSELVDQLGPRSVPDADLLDRFLADRDGEAFALLVGRHGPRVLGVCRRVTGDHHLAEDAFQAVFVVLAARASSVRPRAALPAWLYGVAYRTALRARTMRDRRLRHEKPVETVPEPAHPAVDTVEGADLVAALDEEIARLPESQRVPIVVCELEGQSRQEAAVRLGISEGTLSSRLARARRALADRLRRRGIVLSATGLTAACAHLAPASVPGPLVSAAVACATGPGPVPAPVAALSHGVLRVMFAQKLKILVIASAFLASALFAAERLAALQLPAPAPADSTEPKDQFGTQQQPKTVTTEQPLPKSPNRLQFLRNGHLVLIDPDGKNEKTLAPESGTAYSEARLSPDGKWVALLVTSGEGGQKKKLFVRTIDEKGAGTDLGIECKMFVSLLWSPDGSEIAFSDGTNEPTKTAPAAAHFVVNLRTKEKKALKIPGDHTLTDWSRDGKYFLTTRLGAYKEQLQSRLYLMNRDGTEHQALTDEHQLSAFGRLSPDGKQVLYNLMTPAKDGRGQPKRELAVLDVSTGKSSVVADALLGGEALAFCWSPNGKQIAYVWRERPAGKPADQKNKETESRLVICDPSGKNAEIVATEKGSNPRAVTIGHVDWR